MLDDFKSSQKIVYQMFQNAGKIQKFSHAYLIDANHYPRKLEFAIAIAKFILCPNHYTNDEKCNGCSQCQRIDDANFTELKIISPDGSWIKKEQLEDLQKQFSTKAIESKNKIYIINEAEKMNASAANSILKFLEEPEPGIIAILITDNMYQLLDTIISRCQVISLAKINQSDLTSNKSQITTVEKIGFFIAKTGDEYQKFVQDEEKRNQIDCVVQFVKELENQQEAAILKENKLWTSVFNDKEKMDFGLEVMALLYKDMIHHKIGLEIDFMDDYIDILNDLSKKNTVKQLCDKIEMIIELKNHLKVNANQNLLLDQLILSFQEVCV